MTDGLTQDHKNLRRSATWLVRNTSENGTSDSTHIAARPCNLPVMVVILRLYRRLRIRDAPEMKASHHGDGEEHYHRENVPEQEGNLRRVVVPGVLLGLSDPIPLAQLTRSHHTTLTPATHAPILR